MSKQKVNYVCSECGQDFPRWAGQCTSCYAWNTLSEFKISNGNKKNNKKNWIDGGMNSYQNLSTVNINSSEASKFRIKTNLGELDRVLGGGMVVGSVILLSGDPGIGKSTLLLQTCSLAGENNKALYITGEESLAQITDRAKRLGCKLQNIEGMAENELNIIIAQIEKLKPTMVVIDSIQTMHSEDLESASGTVSQVRECATQLTRLAKTQGFCLWLVGHINKDGAIAGPKVLEHLVDTVLTFEGDQQSNYRLIRTIKNRFGASNEIGAFEMKETGLESVDNPSSMFLNEYKNKTQQQGSVVFIMQDGPRPILIEIQALVDDSTLINPRRLAVGVDYNRLSMLVAVLHKHGGLDGIVTQDIFVNAVGGIKANEPGADLAIIIALLSSYKNININTKIACFGEIGLTGELRPIQGAQSRITEACKVGFEKIIMPKRNLPKPEEILKFKKLNQNIEIEGADDILEAIEKIVGW